MLLLTYERKSADNERNDNVSVRGRHLSLLLSHDERPATSVHVMLLYNAFLIQVLHLQQFRLALRQRRQYDSPIRIISNFGDNCSLRWRLLWHHGRTWQFLRPFGLSCWLSVLIS